VDQHGRESGLGGSKVASECWIALAIFNLHLCELYFLLINIYCAPCVLASPRRYCGIPGNPYAPSHLSLLFYFECRSAAASSSIDHGHGAGLHMCWISSSHPSPGISPVGQHTIGWSCVFLVSPQPWGRADPNGNDSVTLVWLSRLRVFNDCVSHSILARLRPPCDSGPRYPSSSHIHSRLYYCRRYSIPCFFMDSRRVIVPVVAVFILPKRSHSFST